MKCDTSSNDTSSNEPLRLKVTSSKWHFVDCAHCRKIVLSNRFDEKMSWLIANNPVAMLLCCSSHDYGQWRRWPNLNLNRTFYSPVPFAVSFIIKKNVQAYILRLDCLLYDVLRPPSVWTYLNAAILTFLTFPLKGQKSTLGHHSSEFDCTYIDFFLYIFKGLYPYTSTCFGMSVVLVTCAILTSYNIFSGSNLDTLADTVRSYPTFSPK